MKLEDIRELVKLIDESSIDEFEFEKEGTKVVIKKCGGQMTQYVSPSPAPGSVQPNQGVMNSSQGYPTNETQQESEAQSNLHKIVSPMVGTFYTASSPDSDPFVKVGSKVSEDSVVCIVEAMKLFNEIEADVQGEIVEILVENGQLVEYGQPLFLVKTV